MENDRNLEAQIAQYKIEIEERQKLNGNWIIQQTTTTIIIINIYIYIFIYYYILCRWISKTKKKKKH